MTWTLNLRDNYEFKNQHVPAGLTYDDEMWLLNYYGKAQHFKIRGSHTIKVSWPKGYRLKDDDPRAVIEGRLKPFPQCQ